MIAVASLLTVLFISLVVVRIAAEALVLTGLPRDVARFQARSAWTGTGFTTSESEQVVNHPLRRRIVAGLMLLRSVGLVTATSTLMLSFVNVEHRSEGLLHFLILLAGLVVLWLAFRSRWLDRRMSRAIVWALKRFAGFGRHDYAGLLHLAGEYAISELKVRNATWLAGRTLEQLRLTDEGVVVLGLTQQDGAYVGAPRRSTLVRPGDTLLLYGRSSALAELGRRQADEGGDAQHRAAVTRERNRQAEKEPGGADGVRSGEDRQRAPTFGTPAEPPGPAL